MKAHEPRILVVDDQPINVRLLEKKLQRSGMEVVSAFNGQEALAAVESIAPDVILLDIMMPGMDGLEVCRRIKENPRLRDVPIIFITAKTSKEGKIEGLGIGAADYITKPIDLDETVARINTQLRIQQQHRANLELGRRLAETRKRAAIAHVTEGIAHNLNNLLGVVVGYVDLLKNIANESDRSRRSFEQLEKAVRRMVAIVRELTTIAEFDRVRKSPHNVNKLIREAIDRFRLDQKLEAPVHFYPLSPESDFESNAELLEDVIGRLLTNAFESYREEALGREPRVEIRVSMVPGEIDEGDDPQPHLEITVSDTGVGVPERLRDSAFEPFVSSDSAVGRGMGLTIARHSMQALGGQIELHDRPEGGTIIVLRHPLRAAEGEAESSDLEAAHA